MGLTSTSILFGECDNITDVNLSGWDVSQVTDASFTFYHMDSLKNAIIDGWTFEQENVNTTSFFAYSRNLNKISLRNSTKFTFDAFRRKLGSLSNHITLDITNLSLSKGETSLQGLFNHGSYYTKDITYRATWKNVNNEEGEEGSIIIPGSNGGEIIIKPNQDGQLTSYAEDGNINIPDGGVVELPNIGNITAQGGTINPDSGEVILPNGGSITLPNGSIINPEVNIPIPTGENVTLPDENGNNIIIKPGTDGQAPIINEDGNVIMPENGKVELPNIGTVTLPEGGIVKPNGSIEMPNGGNITLTNSGGTLIVQEGSTVKPNGIIEMPIGVITINPSGNTTIPGENGDIILQNGGLIELPGDAGSITIPNGSIINPEGNITLPSGGTVELPSGTITLPNESIMKPNGSIQTPNINNNGGIVITPEGNMTVSGGAIVKPSEDGKLPEINEDGNVIVPETGGTIVLPESAGTVIVPGNAVVKPDGSIIVQEEGTVTLPSGGTVTVKPGTVINSDGTIKDNKPSIFDKIDNNVVEVGKGDGQVNNPIILTVKEVDKTKLNAFLNTLKDLNPKVISITKGTTHTEYKIEVDNKKIPFKEKTYVTIKVDNNKTDLVKALNKFSKGTNEKVEIPILVSFIDVTKHWAKTNIENFASMGLINGYQDGTFKPDASITRAEFVKIINSVFGYTQAGTVTFTDVKKGDWFYNEVAIARQAGYINGKTETTFAPNDKITREEVAKILTTIMKNKDDELDKLNTFPDGNKTSNWAKPYVEGAIEAGYLGGDTQGKLNPTNNITRAEAVTVLSRIK